MSKLLTVQAELLQLQVYQRKMIEVSDDENDEGMIAVEFEDGATDKTDTSSQ